MSLDHRFDLIPLSGPDSYSQLGYRNLVEKLKKPVLLHDDFLFYISDTLRWIPTVNGGTHKIQKQYGLNFCGVTLIGIEGAEVAKAVFEGWATLLSHGPDHLELRGPYSEIVGSGKEGKYSSVRLKKREIVSKLLQLKSHCEEVLHSKGELIIIHLGI